MSWFYAEGGAQKGPLTEEEWQTLVQAGTITGATLVWREGMTDWLPYSSLHTPPPLEAPLIPAAAFVAGEPPADPAAPPPPAPLSFTGDASEYFKIWIVNLLLTLVTLGIYAAWAKVRTKRYFYANTHLFGHAFEYLANPVRILIGNLIVIVLFVSLNLAQTVNLWVWGGLLVFLLVASPWFIIRALAFNARNSAWRGLRFRFEGRYWDAFRIFVLLPLAVPLTLGILYPWVARARREWIVKRHAYGTTHFTFSGEVGEFYRIYVIAFLFIAPLVACYVGLFAVLIPALQGGGQPSPVVALIGLAFIPAMLLAYGGFFYLRVRLFNYAWTQTQIGPHRFEARMKYWDYFGIQFSNAIVTALTFGLMYPWAAVRMAHYVASSLVVVPGGNLDEFVASAQPDVNAVGEAAGDIFDLDVGFDFGL